MNEMSYSAALAKYPAIDENYLNALLEECIRKDPSKIIVLDGSTAPSIAIARDIPSSGIVAPVGTAIFA